MCGWLAYAFDMRGPSVGIDTACSSSLVALHQGHVSCRSNTTSNSVVCGANAILIPETSAMICQLGALSSTGRCLSLDSAADGYGRGEAMVSCLLVSEISLSCIGMLSSTSVNQDGRSISMTAPNGPSQESLIRSCVMQSGLSSTELVTLSIHGTGTLLGDSIEIQALQNVFQGSGVTSAKIVANKSLFGHCEGAAGTTGLANALFTITNLCVNGVSTLRSINAFVQMSLTGKHISPSRSAAPLCLATDMPAYSGTSSFGMSGTNAHAIVAGQIRDGRTPMNRTYNQRWMQAQSFQRVGLGDHCRYIHAAQLHLMSFQIQFMQKSLQQHKVARRPLLPASAQILSVGDIVHECLSRQPTSVLVNTMFLRPFILSKSPLATVSVDLNLGHGELSDSSNTDGSSGQAQRTTSTWIKHTGSNIGRPSASHTETITFAHKSHASRSNVLCGQARGAFSDRSSVLDASFHISCINQSACRVPVSIASFDASHTETIAAALFPQVNQGEGHWADHCLRGHACHTSFLSVKDLATKALVREHAPGILIGRVVFQLQSPVDVTTGWERCLGDAKHAAPLGQIMHSLGTTAQLATPAEFAQYDTVMSSKLSATVGRLVSRTIRRVRISEMKHLGRWKELEQQNLLPTNDSIHPIRLSNKAKMSDLNYDLLICTSLGGIGSLFAQYASVFAGKRVHACSRNNAHRGLRIQSRALLTVYNYDTALRGDAFDLLGSSYRSRIIHTAGTLRDALMENVQKEGVASTLASKASIVSNMRFSLANAAVADAIIFSSIASVFGTPGQAAYATANAVLDLVSDDAFHAGIRLLSFQWGLWEHLGMNARLSKAVSMKLSSSGFAALSAMEGITLFEQGLGWLRRNFASTLMMTKIHPDTFIKFIRSQGHLRHLLGLDAHESPGIQSSDHQRLDHSTSNHSKLHGTLDGSRLLSEISVVIRRFIGDNTPDDDIKSISVLQLGLDSVTSVEFKQELEDAVGVNLPISFVYDYPMVDDMMQYIRDQQQKAVAVRAQKNLNVVTPESPALLSVLAAASKYPSPKCIPQDHQTIFSEPSTSTFVRDMPSLQAEFGYFEAFASAFEHSDLFSFDADLFKFSESMSLTLDPNIRWLLSLHAEIRRLAKAAYVPITGVFLGWMWSHENPQRLAQDPAISITPMSVTGNSAAFAVGHVAYTFALEGPCVPLDTACSSSLVALHLAADSIVANDCLQATVTGVNSFLDGMTWMRIRSISAESRDGRCKTLDAAADGYGRGEAFATMYVSATTEHDTSGSVCVLGTSVNTVANRSSLTAPHGPSQAKAIQRALKVAETDQLAAVSLHGTGTGLGDPIEIRALHQALGKSRQDGPGPYLFSPKSSVGHTEGTAGVTNILASMISIEMCMSLQIHHLHQINPMVISSSARSVPILRQCGPLVANDLPLCGTFVYTHGTNILSLPPSLCYCNF